MSWICNYIRQKTVDVINHFCTQGCLPTLDNPQKVGIVSTRQLDSQQPRSHTVTNQRLKEARYISRYIDGLEQDCRNQESFIRGNLQYMQLTIGCIQFLLYILIWVVGKTICIEQTHIN